MATWNNPFYSTAHRPIIDRGAVRRRMQQTPQLHAGNSAAETGDQAYVSDVGPRKLSVRGTISSGQDAQGLCTLDIHPNDWDRAGCRQVTRPRADFRVYAKGPRYSGQRRY